MMSKLYLPYNNLYGCITLGPQVAKRANGCTNLSKCVHTWFFWSQQGQRPGWGWPRSARWSAVRHWLCMTNQIVKRHLWGVYDFHMRSQASKWTPPWNRASHMDFAEYWSELECLQMCESVTPGCSSTSARSLEDEVVLDSKFLESITGWSWIQEQCAY